MGTGAFFLTANAIMLGVTILIFVIEQQFGVLWLFTFNGCLLLVHHSQQHARNRRYENSNKENRSKC